MDIDRPPHRSTSNSGTTTNELFICFTSRLSSSSSMKLSSKSLLSPGRARDSSQISLSASLSRRLRNSGSLKGGQASPMFPAGTNGKKRGCSFENPEPSSPKVTCIGQVRVKTKKQGKKMRAARSRREVSFRRTEQVGSSTEVNSRKNNSLGDANHYQDYQFQQSSQECLRHRNQRWVHLPVTICEALRAFGAEFNCFLPCRSSCMASNENGGNGNNKQGKVSHHHHRSESSCGAVFARWLVAEKIELVVGGEAEGNGNRNGSDRGNNEEDDDDMPRRSRRRHVFEDIVIDGDKCEFKDEIFEQEAAAEDEEDERKGRVSLSIPPKNALLLMRCRSDPVKMAALANRFWECPPQDEEADEDEQRDEEGRNQAVVEQIGEEAKITYAETEAEEEEAELEEQEEAESKEVNEGVEEELQMQEQHQEDDKQVLEQLDVLEEATAESDLFTVEALADPENEENVANLMQEKENFREDETEAAPEVEKIEYCENTANQRPSFSSEAPCEEAEVTEAEHSTEQKEDADEEEEAQEPESTHGRSDPEEPETGQEPQEGGIKKENLLPDCLLLMMCEPKLSMEVSKETWVCSTDFIRWHSSGKKPPPPPPQIINKPDDGCDEEPKKRVSTDLIQPKPSQQQHKKPPPQQLLLQPPRSSCSFPAAPPLPPALGAPSMKTMNTMIEQKLVDVTKPSYESFALTRCKSEPRKQSAKLAPETCFWKNRKIEPHRPGIGAAGVGFCS